MGNIINSKRVKLEKEEENKNKRVENKRAFIINLIYFLIVVSIVYIVIKYALVWFLPFVIGFGVAFILKPLIRKISNKYSMSNKLVAGLLVTIFYLTVGALLTVGIIKTIVNLKELAIGLPDLYFSRIEPIVFDLINQIDKSVSNLDPSIVQGITDVAMSFGKSVAEIITNISRDFAKFISSVVGSVPAIFLSIIFSIVSSYFFAIDYNLITTFITRQFSKKAANTMFEVKDQIVGTLFKLLKSYTILISMTFIELSIGFVILGINNPFQIALLIAFVDILPILGTGGVIVPWAVYSLIKNNLYLGIGLLVLYILITVIRNITEPKLVGKQVGLHPLIMLICMYIGIKIFGFIGIFILPIIIIILVNLNKSGKINIFK